MCETTGLSVDLVAAVLDCILATIANELATGRRAMQFRGFGTFENVMMRGHGAMNINKREKMWIPPMRRVKFTPGRMLRQMLRELYSETEEES